MEVRVERKKHLRGLGVKGELMTQLQISNKSLLEANQKLERLFVEVEKNRLQHIADECELRKCSELDSLKNEYVAMVSHELRSPLTSVRGAVGLLSTGVVGPESAKGTKLFRIALTNLDRMIRLINDVLDLERIASGPSLLKLEQCSVEDLVKQAIDTMMPIAQEVNVELVSTRICNMRGSELFFHGDADKILQVVINLLSNAIKFSPPGAEVVIDVKAFMNTVTVRISDEGRGIPEDQLLTVFERFQQLQQDDARRLGGTGLGLAICRSIVEQHGGNIWAERNSGKGTSFSVTLPRSRCNTGTVSIQQFFSNSKRMTASDSITAA
jgi:signal transduction histidine kinase